MHERIYHCRFVDLEDIIDGFTADENVRGNRLIQVQIIRSYGTFCDVKMLFLHVDEFLDQKVVVLKIESFVFKECRIEETIEEFNEYKLQFRYDRDFRVRNFVILCFER